MTGRDKRPRPKSLAQIDQYAELSDRALFYCILLEQLLRSLSSDRVLRERPTLGRLVYLFQRFRSVANLRTLVWVRDDLAHGLGNALERDLQQACDMLRDAVCEVVEHCSADYRSWVLGDDRNFGPWIRCSVCGEWYILDPNVLHEGAILSHQFCDYAMRVTSLFPPRVRAVAINVNEPFAINDEVEPETPETAEWRRKWEEDARKLAEAGIARGLGPSAKDDDEALEAARRSYNEILVMQNSEEQRQEQAGPRRHRRRQQDR